MPMALCRSAVPASQPANASWYPHYDCRTIVLAPAPDRTDHVLLMANGERRRRVLELDWVTKTYPSEPPVQALRGVSLVVHEGELVAVVGPSGSGKTTLLHLVGTLDRPSSGTVRVTGLDVAKLSDRELAALRATRIGFVFQQFFLAEHESALDNVGDGCSTPV